MYSWESLWKRGFLSTWFCSYWLVWIFMLFFIMCVCMCVCQWVCMCVHLPWSLRDEVILELEFLAVVSCLIRVLRNRLESSTKVVPDINHWTSPHPYILNLRTMGEAGKQSFFFCTPVSLCNSYGFKIIWPFKRHVKFLYNWDTIVATDMAIFWQSNQQGSYGSVLYVFIYIYIYMHAYIYIIHVYVHMCMPAFFLRDLWKFCIYSGMKHFTILSFFYEKF